MRRRDLTGLALEVVSGGLDKNTKTVASPLAVPRTDRYRAREYLRGVSDSSRVRKCGHALGGSVRLQGVGDSSGISGISVQGALSCGRIWVCPVCSGRISAGRAQDLEVGVNRWLQTGGRLGLLTLTMRHSRGQGLEQLWDGLSGAWRHMVRSGTYRRSVQSMGMRGYHRTTEVTHGRHGWHIHLHVLFFLDPSTEASVVRRQADIIIAAWLHALNVSGFTGERSAQDWQHIRHADHAGKVLATYLHKGVLHERQRSSSSLALEVSRSDLKRARTESRTPFEILQGLADGEHSPADIGIWLEWQHGSTGRRAHVWSRGLRDLLRLGRELSDEELLEEPRGVDLLEIEARYWRALLASPDDASALIASAIGCSTFDRTVCRLSALLTARNIPHRILYPIGPAG